MVSIREYKVIKIGSHRLEVPIMMSITAKCKKKTQCFECGDEINMGETFLYDPEAFMYDRGAFYCLGCAYIDIENF